MLETNFQNSNIFFLYFAIGENVLINIYKLYIMTANILNVCHLKGKSTKRQEGVSKTCTMVTLRTTHNNTFLGTMTDGLLSGKNTVQTSISRVEIKILI